MTFTRIALNKPNDLLKSKDFVKIMYVSDSLITIEFTASVCNVTDFGKVTWLDKSTEV